MYKRPNDYNETIKILVSATDSMRKYATDKTNNDDAYKLLWNGANELLKMDFPNIFLHKVCGKSAVSQFIVNSLSPHLEKMLREPEFFSSIIDKSIMDVKYGEYSKDAYEIINNIRRSSKICMERKDRISEDLRTIAVMLNRIVEFKPTEEFVRIMMITIPLLRKCTNLMISQITQILENEYDFLDKEVPFNIMMITNA